MSALALSTSVGCFVLKAIGMARLNNLELGVLGGLSLVQLIIPLIAVHAWTGGLTDSRSACYLRIHSWFGIFSLLPLITLAFVLGLLVVGHANEKYRCKKPMGYSYFPYEVAPIPKAWAATTGNLVWHKQHSGGGHFAAMEKPKEMAEDIESFMKTI